MNLNENQKNHASLKLAYSQNSKKCVSPLEEASKKKTTLRAVVSLTKKSLDNETEFSFSALILRTNKKKKSGLGCFFSHKILRNYRISMSNFKIKQQKCFYASSLPLVVVECCLGLAQKCFSKSKF